MLILTLTVAFFSELSLSTNMVHIELPEAEYPDADPVKSSNDVLGYDIGYALTYDNCCVELFCLLHFLALKHYEGAGWPSIFPEGILYNISAFTKTIFLTPSLTLTNKSNMFLAFSPLSSTVFSKLIFFRDSWGVNTALSKIIRIFCEKLRRNKPPKLTTFSYFFSTSP